MSQTMNAAPVRYVFERSQYAEPSRVTPLPRDEDQRSLAPAEINAVLARCGIVSLTHTLDDGCRRSRRARYVYVDDALIIPASECPQSLCCQPSDVPVDCDVSELNGLSHWHYVWLHGSATCWQPTGAAPERRVWREGIDRLRTVLPRLARTEDLVLENFGVVRIAIQTRGGRAIRMS
jgi:hypothetical protein